jgi:hypothetical protein
MAVTALEAAEVRRRLDPAALPFDTTAVVPPLHGTIGQDRALDAIAFGVTVGTPGYNLFVAGAAGSGREWAGAKDRRTNRRLPRPLRVRVAAAVGPVAGLPTSVVVKTDRQGGRWGALATCVTRLAVCGSDVTHVLAIGPFGRASRSRKPGGRECRSHARNCRCPNTRRRVKSRAPRRTKGAGTGGTPTPPPSMLPFRRPPALSGRSRTASTRGAASRPTSWCPTSAMPEPLTKLLRYARRACKRAPAGLTIRACTCTPS